MFTCMVFKISLTFLLQTEALPPANEKSFLWILKKARCRRHFWAFGLSLKEHCFHQFESNLKTRHYEYAFDFWGYFIYSFVSMFPFFMFISYLFSKKTVFLYFLKTMIIDKEQVIFLFLHHFFVMFFHFIIFYSIFYFFFKKKNVFCIVVLFFYFCLFPTCQVRVVRFYQSCCPPPSPPPPVSPRPCLHQLPPPLPPCQLFANFRAQCALLDLNLGPSQLSAHCWTSTWDLPSSVRTAGPQPGTFPAQCAPLDLNLGPSQLSAHRWTSTWDFPSSVRTAGPGTFRAQCAPLDLNLGLSQLSEHRWTSTAR